MLQDLIAVNIRHRNFRRRNQEKIIRLNPVRLILELWERLSAISQADNQHFQLHASQEMLADATGLSSVHVSRTLNTMQREGLIERQGHGYLVIDNARLRQLVPDLHLMDRIFSRPVSLAAVTPSSKAG